MTTLTLTGHDLSLEDVYACAVAEPGTYSVQIHPDAQAAIHASRQVIEEVLASGETVYGVNTGFGALSSISIPADQLEALQHNLVRSHAAGTGDYLDRASTRAMLLLRANTLCKGFSGVRLKLIEQLINILNADIQPVIPCQGSLGASGDLAPLAHMALVLIGEGEAFYKGERLPGSTVLARAGLSPIQLQAKEGLALLNGTQMMSAIGTLTLLKAEQLLLHAEIASAMTIEAVQGSHKPFSEKVAQVRAHPGHWRSAQLSRLLLTDSDIVHAHAHCHKVQDPYSLRCIPQVHGAIHDTLASVRKVLTTEINSATDNPLVFPDGEILSQGNFHGEPVAMALDHLSIAISELASLSERRIDKLMNPIFSELPAFLTGKTSQEGLNSGLMIVHYTAASLVSENKVLAHPACLDSIPTSNDKEDHVSMGALAARKAEKIVEHSTWVISAELLAAAQGLEFRNGLTPGKGVWAAYQAIRKEIPPIQEDRVFSQDVAVLVKMIASGSLLHTVQQACPEFQLATTL